MSFRSHLLVVMLVLGLAAIGLTGWESSVSSTDALRQATFERLTAIRETKGRQVEDYFAEMRQHVRALAADESNVSALEQFSAAWDTLGAGRDLSPLDAELREYYAREVAPRLNAPLDPWLPRDPRQQLLQHWFLSGSPFAVGFKEQLLVVPDAGKYGEAHARFHPTLTRYQTAFRVYDIFLIDARTSRVLYSVFKEIDLGADLSSDPYRHTSLGEVFHDVLSATTPDEVALRDYQFYAPSYFAPAAFMAAPVTRAGAMIGVLALQVSVDDVNRVMTGDRGWASEGLGQTGQAYIAAADGTVRSDMRFELEDIGGFLERMRVAGVDAGTLSIVERNKTGVLSLPVSKEVADLIALGASGTGLGTDIAGQAVLRSFAPVAIPGVNWFLIAEIEAAEAFAQVSALRMRMVRWGAVVAVAIAVAAWWLGRTLSAPVLALAARTRAVGRRDFERVPVAGPAEVQQLGEAFNRMTEDLQRTTVSRDELTRAHQQLQALTERLIRAQEEERKKLARDLHDDLTQRIASLSIEAGRLKRLDAATPEWRDEVARLQEGLSVLSRDVHALSRQLHPAMLDDLGLVAAIEAHVKTVREAGGPSTTLRAEGDPDALGPDVRLAFYRIAQESLQNARRHGRASEVEIVIRNDPESAQLVVRDNGQGFDAASSAWRPGLGLASIEERARLLGGQVSVTSGPERGTEVSVTIPYRHDDPIEAEGSAR